MDGYGKVRDEFGSGDEEEKEDDTVGANVLARQGFVFEDKV